MQYGFVPALGTPLNENGQLCKKQKLFQRCKNQIARDIQGDR